MYVCGCVLAFYRQSFTRTSSRTKISFSTAASLMDIAARRSPAEPPTYKLNFGAGSGPGSPSRTPFLVINSVGPWRCLGAGRGRADMLPEQTQIDIAALVYAYGVPLMLLRVSMSS